MRLVIPYRLPQDGGIELRYSIRSMVKHFKPLSGVLLIGDKPEWFTGDHIPFADIPGEKERSMQLKVLQAPDEFFCYSNDDFFAQQDFDEYTPKYYDTDCGDMATRHPIESYRKMYNNCLPRWLNYDIHTPMLMTSKRFKAAFEKMDAQTPIKTTVGNFHGRRFPIVPNYERLADCKIKGEHSYDEIIYATKDRPFFSTHNNAINADMINFLESKYPDVSPFEKIE